MPTKGSIEIHGDARNSVIISGDNNRVDAKITSAKSLDLNDLSDLQQMLLSEAIKTAFTPESLTTLLKNNHRSPLHLLVAPGPFEQQALDLVKLTQNEGWTTKLVELAQKNIEVRNLINQLRLVDIEGNPHLVRNSLERTVKEKAGIQDFVAWAQKLTRLGSTICRIEDPRDTRRALGTGFLVSSDLVLTNYHVVDTYIDAVDPTVGTPRDTSKLRCRFDYAIDSTGENPGTVKSLAIGPRWLVNYAKYSGVDPGDQGGLPQETQLDYALLRLSERVGDTPGPDGRGKRGWINISSLSALPEPTDVIFILQHPKGDPLKLAVGTVIKQNENGTRLRYDTNTEGGSSGSPCLDAKLNLVALHHGGDPDTGRLAQFNQGVPIDRIVAHLAAQPALPRFWETSS